MNKAWAHFKTVTLHRRLVRRRCFRVGLYWQGLTHDLSKFSPTEFLVGCRYYQGNRSPNNAEREDRGYSSSWLHHKGRNKHHYEYWLDVSLKDGAKVTGMRMPERYVVEMLMDRLSASQVYQKENYTDRSALEFYQRRSTAPLLHPDTRELLERLLTMVAEQGEEETFRYIRREVLKNAK